MNGLVTKVGGLVGRLVGRLVGDKRDWRVMRSRARALPGDYRIVYDEIESYLFRFSAGGGMDVIAVLKDLLDLFETGAAGGKGVLEVTGTDVAEFCDELLRSTDTYTGTWHHDLNRDVVDKLRQGRSPT